MKKTIQLFAIVVALAFTTTISAQIPDNGIWPAGQSYTDLNGVVHDIDAILDSGKPVFIDAFADWCGPCWSYHQTHALENLHTQYGPGGTDELVVLGIESDPATPASAITNPNSHPASGDWSNGITYPLINDNTIASVINQAYYPTIIMICPDRMVTEVGQASTTNLYNRSKTCASSSSHAVDPRLIENTSVKDFCEGGEAGMSVLLQNFGTTPLTSAQIEVFEGTTSVATKNWTGNLATYEVEDVYIGSVAPSAQTTYSIEITSTNDDTANDKIAAVIKPASVLEVGITHKELSVVLNVDQYTSEIGMVLDEGDLPSTDYMGIYNNASISNPIGYVKMGTYPNNAGIITETWSVNDEGCHYIVLVDKYGDGYTFNKPTASVRVKGWHTASLPVSASFEKGTHRIFEVKFTGELGVNDEEFASNFKTYPNPANNLVNVEFELKAQSEAIVSIVNTVGQTVAVNNLGTVSGMQTTQMDVSGLDSGMYIVKIKTTNGEQTKRISIIK